MLHKISGDSNNKNIDVHKGDTVEIALAETPTTGYSWEIDDIDTQVLELRSTAYKMHNSTGVGAGGTRIMIFLVSGKGKGFIKLKNWRKWNGNIHQQFQIDVNAH